MNTLFDKIWDAHVVQKVEDGPTQLYIDRLYCHEVTSPQAFSGLRERGIKCFRPEKIFCMPDHNTPTHDQDKPIEDPVSKTQVDTLAKNAEEFGLAHFGMMDKKNGIIHVVGPERGLTLPGMTIVCGDSHTSTHGAMGAVAFGIGTSEVEMVMASQCILQTRPKTMRITVDGKLGKGVTAKDVALYMMSKMTTSGATGYFVEYAGEAVRTDAAELVNQGEAGEDRPVVDPHMAGQRGVVDQDAVVADHAVVADMYIGHQQVVTADGGFAAILHGATVDGHAFANHIVIADHQPGGLALVLEVRGILAHRGKLVDLVVLADHGRPLEHDMRTDHGTLADFHIGPDDRPRADLDIRSQLGRRIDDGARVDQTHSLRSAQMISAEQTSLPSTLARHSNFQMLRLTLRKRASSTSWSPGSTG